MTRFNCQPFLDQIVKIFTDTGLIEQFSSEDTMGKKLRFCLNLSDITYSNELVVNIRDKLRDLLEAFYQFSKKEGKSEKNCIKFKDKGTKAFLRKKLSEAHSFYSEALRNAPCSSTLIPILYANRSAVLIEMGNYEDCLADIECAKDSDYPLELMHKLILRKATCLTELRCLEEAQHALEQLKLNKDSWNISGKQLKTMSELELAIKTEGIYEKSKTNSVESKSLFKSESKFVGNMSSALEMRSNDVQGRFIVSCQEVPRGSIVFQEKAFASILLPEYSLVHCQYCLKKTLTSIPCEKCTDVIWCSVNCRNAGRSFHRYECGLFSILSGIGIAHLSLRVFLKAGLELCRKIGFENDVTEECKVNSHNFNGHSLEEQYRAVHSLLTHLEKVNPGDQLSYAWVAIIMSEAILEKTSYISDINLYKSSPKCDSEIQSLKHELQVEMCCILMHHISQLIANAHAIYEVSDTANDDSDVACISQKSIACAIYPTVSLMNHSCKPSIINCFNGDTITIRSIADLKGGDEVYNCYGPHYVNQTRSERQDDLFKQYFFKCNCIACTDDSYLINEANWSGLICSCGGTALWEGSEDENGVSVGKIEENLKCITGCKKIYAPSKELIEKCTRVSNLYDEGIDFLDKGSLDEAKLNLSMANEEGANIYVIGNTFLNTIRDTLAKILVKKGEFEQSFYHLKQCMDCLIKRYGDDSIEVAHEMIKVLDIVKLYQKSKPHNQSDHSDKIMKFSINYECDINRILNIHYGQQWREFLQMDLRNISLHTCDSCKLRH